MKPSQAKVGDVFYRYESHLVSIGVDEWDESLGSRMELYCHEFTVTLVYPKGALIHAWTRPEGLTLQRVMDHYVNKYAYPTKAEALLGFIARKRRQQSIISNQLARSKEAQTKAEQMLAKELQC